MERTDLRRPIPVRGLAQRRSKVGKSRLPGVRIFALVLVGCCACSSVRAQDESFHWAYAAHFGTGRYALNGHSETIVLSVAPGWTWREPFLDQAGERRPGFRFLLPVAIGAYEFSSFNQIGKLNLGSINSISAVPGVEIRIPMSERWTLKTLGFVGLGTETGGGTDARIFRLGFRSQLRFMPKKTELLLVNGIGRIGYSADGGLSSQINLLLTGFDFRRPLQNRKIVGVPANIHWHVLHTRYLDSLGLSLAEFSARPVTVSSEWELGFAMSKQVGSFNLWKLKLDRIGLAYRFGADGKFSGVGIVFKSLFDR
jgi:hypothetical protein